VTLILENGTGVLGANALVNAAFVTAYLTERNRSTENGWGTASSAAKDAACIAGTDYVEQAFRDLFRGSKEFLDLRVARATWQPTAQPLNTETVTIGTVTYRFVTALALANDVLIGSSLSATIDNLVSAVVAAESELGVTIGTGTVENEDATAQAWYDDTLVVFARVSGTPGNAVAVSSTVTGATWLNSATTLTGGSDVVRAQPLSFPRLGLYDRDGVRVIGVPQRVKFAVAEYSVRARAAVLAPDPAFDTTGGVLTRVRKKVGPIETDKAFTPGTAGVGLLRPYPAADRFLAEYLHPRRVIR